MATTRALCMAAKSCRSFFFGLYFRLPVVWLKELCPGSFNAYVMAPEMLWLIFQKSFLPWVAGVHLVNVTLGWDSRRQHCWDSVRILHLSVQSMHFT